MRIALDPGAGDARPRIHRLVDGGAEEVLPDLSAVAELERSESPRWVLARPRAYRRLLDAGVSVARVHDVELVEGVLVAADGHHGRPHGLAAAAAARPAGGSRPGPRPGPRRRPTRPVRHPPRPRRAGRGGCGARRPAASAGG